MNSVKIILAVVVIATLCFFSWKWMQVEELDAIEEEEAPINIFYNEMENLVDSLDNMPANEFCKTFYEIVQHRINDLSTQQLLGDGSHENSQLNKVLLKNLYSAYAPKFAEQAMYVFSQSSWKQKDLDFIRSELQILKSSVYLDPAGPLANTRFSSIKNTLDKYDEINNFISGCDSFNYSNNDLTQNFPDLSNKINESRAYLDNIVGSSYVNNCNNLRITLASIPYNLFKKHIKYLKLKIETHGKKYKTIMTQPDYNTLIYNPLYDKLKSLDNHVYSVEKFYFRQIKEDLGFLLSEFNDKAYDHYFPQYDCETKKANIGDACNDYNSVTNNDIIQFDCSCKGTP